MNKQGNNKGFTLMELLLVMVLLGFLIAAGVGSYISSLKKSRDSKRKNDLRQIALALETYNNDVGRYPFNNINGEIRGCVDGATACIWGNSFQSGSTLYMPTLPGDASSSQQYYYYSDGTMFQIYARLENTLDTDVPKNSQGAVGVYANTNCATGGSSVYCNYGVASANTSPETGHIITYE